jgi:dihydrofolate reductase
MIISLVVVADKNGGIGLNNSLLCHLPADLKYFRLLTTGHRILMGRKTYMSVGRPLPNRINMVVSRQENLAIEGCEVHKSLEFALAHAKDAGEQELFIIGGAEIYKQAFPVANKIYLTQIHHQFEADAFFPLPDETWRMTFKEPHKADEKNIYDYDFCIYEKVLI